MPPENAAFYCIITSELMTAEEDEQAAFMQYINVVIENKSNNIDAFFTYRAPDEVTEGCRVSVTFGMRKKPLDAYCVETGVIPDYDIDRIKDIIDFEPERSLTKEMIDTAIWMRRRYGIRYFDGIKLFTASGRKLPKPRKFTELSLENPPVLSEDQQHAADRICSSVDSGHFGAYLIKGVTNSGKTEVYMRTAERILEQGRSVIILLPEIALSSQIEQRFRKRFGDSTVATLHSRLTTSGKLGEWMRIRSGEARIVVGPRTAVFAPLENIGGIIIDEEHESTYKSDHNPKYDTVDIAYKRAMTHNAVLVLGSATPSIVSYSRAQRGIYELIRMDKRIGESTMPEPEIVDMRRETVSGNTGVISARLAEEVDAALRRKEQVILFLNRRGFSTQILCPDCGFRMTCPDCGITLTYHKSSDSAVCHYCGRSFDKPDKCPDCGNTCIKYAGAGTEKVEEAAAELWPSASVARFDLDTATDSKSSGKVIEDFQSGRTDILVGTQILAKGLDFRNVAVAGIINADASLNIPDYRSSERTFQLITQVAGRAGRAGGRSHVLIQTYDPGSEVIRQAADGDYESFYESELLHRNIMNYPPYSDIIAVSAVASDEHEAVTTAEAFRERLLTLRDAPKGQVILKTRIEDKKTDGKVRAVFLIKAPAGTRSGYISEYLEFREQLIKNKDISRGCYIEADINPYSIT